MNKIRQMFMMEAGFIGLIGGVFGLLPGWVMGLVLNQAIQSYFKHEESPLRGPFFVLTLWLAAGPILFATLIGLVAGLLPEQGLPDLWSKEPIYETMGPRAQVMSILRLRYIFCGAVLVTLCTGCWPLRITSSPGASGVVLDAKTHAPITGAEAVMLRAELGETPQMENARPPVAITGNDGKFCIPRERKWILYSISPGLPPANGILAISHQDYQTKFIPMQSPVGRASEESERKYEDAGSILLQPARR